MTKSDLFQNGLSLLLKFGQLNDFELPTVELPTTVWPFNACAYWRDDVIHINVKRCAHIGTGGASWSYPGYVIDRTPYGVLAHELGHHVDWHLSAQRGPYFGDFSIAVRKATQEPAITKYCTNHAEWFAEMFRLFCTNSDLLRYLRPKTYAALRERFTPPERRSWATVLIKAPRRTVLQTSRKIQRVGESR